MIITNVLPCTIHGTLRIILIVMRSIFYLTEYKFQRIDRPGDINAGIPVPPFAAW